jgi:hypothetical protein
MDKPRHPSQIVVKIGKFDLSQTFERGSAVGYPSEIFVNPNWKHWTQDYDSDIALIILESKVQVSDAIFPICLWNQANAVSSEANGIIVGWGKNGNTASVSKKPRELQVKIKTNEECFLKNPRFAAISSLNTFCAGKDEFSGPCSGKTETCSSKSF